MRKLQPLYEDLIGEAAQTVLSSKEIILRGLKMEGGGVVKTYEQSKSGGMELGSR